MSDYLADARSDAERIAQRERIFARAKAGETFDAQIVRDLLRDIGFLQGCLQAEQDMLTAAKAERDDLRAALAASGRAGGEGSDGR